MFYATVIITGTMSVILVSCGFFPSGWDVGVMYMLRVDLSSLGSLKVWYNSKLIVSERIVSNDTNGLF